MTNTKIRNEAKTCGVRLWQVADALGVTDGALSRKLRHELPEQEQARLVGIIHEIAAEREGVSV